MKKGVISILEDELNIYWLKKIGEKRLLVQEQEHWKDTNPFRAKVSALPHQESNTPGLVCSDL